MRKEQMISAILEYAYLNDARENATYEMTDAEERRFYRAIRETYAKLHTMAHRAHFDQEVFEKLYGE